MSHTLEMVRAKLIATGKKQEEIEAGSGVAQSAISRILSGKTFDPRISTLDKLDAYADAELKRQKLRRKSSK